MNIKKLLHKWSSFFYQENGKSNCEINLVLHRTTS